MITDASWRCGTRLLSSSLLPQGPLSASDARQPGIDQVGRRLNLGVIRVPLPGVDEQHLAGRDLSFAAPVIEMQSTDGDDQRHRDRVPMFRNVLPWFESQANHAHGPAVRDLLETERPTRSLWTLR